MNWSRNKIFKNTSTFAFASILSCALISANPACADNYPTTLGDNSAYTLTETTETTGTGIYDIPQYDAATQSIIHKYYKLNIKTGVVSESRLENTTDNSSTNYSGHYIEQSITSTSSDVNGGAIYNNGVNAKLGNLTGDFVGNMAKTTAGWRGASGGAIYNEKGTIDNITGDFIGNTSYGSSNVLAIIYNSVGTIGNINGNFIGNRTLNYPGSGLGATIFNDENSIMGNITGNFSNNTVTGWYYAEGAAIFNGGIMGNIIGNFSKNIASAGENAAKGGGIFNAHIIGDIVGDFIGNSAEGAASSYAAKTYGGAIYNDKDYTGTATIGNITGNFIGNSSAATQGKAYGGAIFNYSGTIGDIKGSFIGNYASSDTNTAQGGAIWTNTDLTLVSDAGETEIKDNYTSSAGEIDDNAIYVANDATLTLKQINNGKMSIYDNVRGSDNYNVNITGDGTGTMYLFNDLYGANVTMGNTDLNTINNAVHNYNFKSLTLAGDINMFVDVDLANETMDRLTADSYGAHVGILTVKGVNLISDSKNESVSIYFAQPDLAQNVTSPLTTVGEDKSQTTAYAPIYRYGIKYVLKPDTEDASKDAGYFELIRMDKIIPDSNGGGGNKSEVFNPAVLATPVATQAAGQASINQTFNYAFQHSDMFMNLPMGNRMAKIHGNEIALSTDYNRNLGHFDLSKNNKAIWVKPYTSFDRTDLKNGPKVDSVNYGTLVGGDSEFRKLKKGWANVGSAYVGYFGSQVDYNGVDSSLNGGLVGLTETFYKGNFFTGITATVGGGAAENHTMYGKDDVAMMMAGLASKTGYNFEFNEGKFIIQPLLMMNYTMVKSFDYTNAAGVKINSDPMHTIQINPTLRAIGNLKNGWQPYASVGMVWNLMNETNVTANGVDLPSMHTRPYVEYGVGVQKLWNDSFSGYGQVMMRNGGRTGVALTAGFRWTIGNDNKKIEKVQKDNDKNIVKVNEPVQKKVLKSAI